MTDTRYVQCRLLRTHPWSVSCKVVFIPKKFAKCRNTVSLKNDEGEWEDGWKVVKVYPTTERAEPPDVQKQVREHRKNTGDADKPSHISTMHSLLRKLGLQVFTVYSARDAKAIVEDIEQEGD